MRGEFIGGDLILGGKEGYSLRIIDTTSDEDRGDHHSYRNNCVDDIIELAVPPSDVQKGLP